MNMERIKGTCSHGIFVPTHRKIQEKVLDSVIKESQIAKYDYGINAPIFILDDTKSSDAFRHNIQLISSQTKKQNGIDIHFISKSDQSNFIDQASKDLNIRIDLLQSQDLNYGTIFNKLFLIGQIFGIKTYHRRDSDVFVKRHQEMFSPIVKELDLINKIHEGQKINIVGGNYLDETGQNSDSALRLEECMKTPSFLTAFLQCIPQNDMDVVTELKEILKTEPSPQHGNSNDFNIATFGSPYYVDCGNVCFTDYAFRVIPSAPNDNLIGADYHLFNIAKITHLGIVAHNHPLLHEKQEIKTSPQEQLKYWNNMYNFCDAEAFHFLAYADMEKKVKDNAISSADTPEKIGMAFANSLIKAKEAIPIYNRIELMDRLSDALLLLGKSSFEQIAIEQRRSKYEACLQKTIQDVNKYIELLIHWQDVVNYFQTTRFTLKEETPA